MTSVAARALLAELRRAGIGLRIHGDHLRVAAQKGVVTAEIKGKLRTSKPEILAVLNREVRLLGLSLDDFERQSFGFEARVEWLQETLWFVPLAEHAALLMQDGVAPGRIWTAAELRYLHSLVGDSSNDVRSIARLKAELGLTILSIEDSSKDSNEVVGDPTRPCFACQNTRFWISVHGARTCATCHPPASPDLVVEWIDTSEMGDPSPS